MSDPIEESAKAVQSVAKTTNNAIDKGAELARFVGKVFGPAIEDIGVISKQYTEYWKIRNALRLRDKLDKALGDRGNPSLKELPLRIGLPLLDGALNEDDDTLQNLWANLLASAMTEEAITAVTRSYVEALKQLDVVDGELLNALFHMHLSAVVKDAKTYINTTEKRDIVQISVAVNNLERLGIIKVFKSNHESSDEPIISLMYRREKDPSVTSFTIFVSLTLFGFHLMRACTEKKLLAKEGGEFVPIDDRFEYAKANKPPKS
jgi:hypothetical protein